tara:strand:+ start:301 stop:450 length:150 start_codon:yes stop_codon:yes gene_type:complete
MKKNNEYYAKELQTPLKDKLKAIAYQKYYTVGSIILMFVVLAVMFLMLG